MSKDELIATISLLLAPIIIQTRKDPMPQIIEAIEAFLRDYEPAAAKDAEWESKYADLQAKFVAEVSACESIIKGFQKEREAIANKIEQANLILCDIVCISGLKCNRQITFMRGCKRWQSLRSDILAGKIK